ncbi:MAG TPA: carboxypeptidase regulatory-like domain-containing protein [Chloroflexaceae bacterium]|nr:carboxypeptidase regulatory-like domain-containing protein [Chloroflexaceae bacterium]
MIRSLRAPLTLVAAVLLLGGMFAAGPGPGAALAAADVATCAPNSGSATIAGIVTAPGGTPLSGVQVTAYTDYGRQAGGAFTNNSGVYQIGGLIGGSYLLRFAPQGGEHQAEWYADQPTALTAAPVAVPEGGLVSGINAELAVGARFSGNVAGLGGGVLAGIAVTVYDASGERVASAFTDAAGDYTTRPGLPSGTYRIGFGGGSGFLAGYYSGAATLEAATPLTVSAPTVRGGINGTLAPGGRISGTVTSAATGLPLAGIAVSASGPGGSDFDYTDASGDYELAGLGSGGYTVSAAPSSGTVNLVRATRQAAVSAPGAATGVNFALAAGATLSGTVTGPGGTPLNNILVYISDQDGSFQNYYTTNATGVYSATGLPAGDYRVLFRPSNYIPEAYNNRPDFGQADRIVVPAQGTVSGIDAELAPGASVRGRVTDAATNLPIKDIFVEVLDLDGGRVETAFTQADGTYATPPTLASGQYLVRFNADERFASCAYVTAYYGGALREEDAARLTVSAPAPATGVDAQLTRGSILFGRVTDAATGAPITRGQVSVRDGQNRSVGSGRLTFLGGWYTGTALPSGSYRLRFSDSEQGYIDEYYDDAPSFEQATPVVVTAPTDLTGLDAALAQGAAIAGRVTAGDTGAPFRAGYVVVYSLAGEEVGYGDIAEDGSYQVRTGLPSGSYYVAAVPYGAEGGLAAAPAQGGEGRSAYAISFFGGSVTRAAAERVAVSAPQLRGGVNIVMLRASWLPMLRR